MDIVERFEPCPFCGGTDVRRYGDNFVGCHPCGIAVDIGHCVGPEARKDSANEWNKRADNAEITRLRARLAEAEAAKADAWDEAMKAAAKTTDYRPECEIEDDWDKGWTAGCRRTARAIRALVNPYRSKTDE